MLTSTYIIFLFQDRLLTEQIFDAFIAVQRLDGCKNVAPN